MIAALRGKGSERLWRLFAVACARRMEDLMRDPRSRDALEVAERFADGAATRQELSEARLHARAAADQAFREAYEQESRSKFLWDADYEAALVAQQVTEAALQCVAEDIAENFEGQTTALPADLQYPDLLREVFGNPFRWTHADPAWLSWNDGTVGKVAQAIYDQRAFDRLPVLADALEEAGCTNGGILDHCRQPGEHVRGCWVVDLLLGKE
jgi:hypothetical protein